MFLLFSNAKNRYIIKSFHTDFQATIYMLSNNQNCNIKAENIIYSILYRSMISVASGQRKDLTYRHKYLSAAVEYELLFS